ncbi:peptide chain release factor APG3, chloroplastic [Artemisia annua]|uniref:Peptide chain release factor APG3, chloroplastic n=1 Tax=Artemisia annua TaxID=35608 RepID=A0A2U1KHN0_ARTAN|nr:peptide chain release factor APG3, chloroplastic [Artemisia annua]
MVSFDVFVIKTLWGNMLFDFATSSARGRSGGILCVWDKTLFHKKRTYATEHCLCVEGTWMATNSDLLFISVYSPQDLSLKRVLWNYMTETLNRCHGEVIIMGDFNEVRFASERHGSYFHSLNAAEFNMFIANSQLIDIPLGGYSFTWSDKHASKMSKLDRFLVSQGILDLFPNLTGLILHRHISDHRPILLKETFVDYGPTPFRLYHSWFLEDDFHSVIVDSWNNDGLQNGIVLRLKAIFRGVWILFKLVIWKENSTWIGIIKAINKLKAKGVDLMGFCKLVIGNGSSTSFWHDRWYGDTCLKEKFKRLFNLELHKDVSVASKLQTPNVVSSFRRLLRSGIENSQLVELVQILSSISLSSANDRWSWTLHGLGEFSVKLAREEIDKHVLVVSPSHSRWSKVLPIKLNVFLWRMLLDRLPTRSNLYNRGIDIACVLCPNCGAAIENRNHLFFGCSMSVDLARLIGRWWNIHIPIFGDPSSWETWFDGLNHSSLQKGILEATFISMWWHIWKFRNSSLFSSKKPRKEMIFDDIEPYLLKKLESAEKTWKELSVKLADPDVVSNPSEYQKLAQSMSELDQVVTTYKGFKDCEKQLEESKGFTHYLVPVYGFHDLLSDYLSNCVYFPFLSAMSKDADLDEEMAEMIASEIESLTEQLKAYEEKLKMMLLPSDPLDSRNILLEVRAGTGGEEAGLWAADLVDANVPVEDKSHSTVKIPSL